MNGNEVTPTINDKLAEVLSDLDPRQLSYLQDTLHGIENLIRICGDDPNRDGLIETPQRVLKAFLEYTSGSRVEPKDHLKKQFVIEHDELILIKDIEFYSVCEHHFAPFFGVAHVGYIPSSNITGLSKIARMVEDYAKRFQVQERMNSQIVLAIEEILQPVGAMAVIEAKHMCMCGRGIKKGKATTVTTASTGIFKTDSNLRNEFLSLLKRNNI